ncbi:hypothetical protein [Longimicrobium sp.]
MVAASFSEAQLKDVLKAALIEVLEERPVSGCEPLPSKQTKL